MITAKRHALRSLVLLLALLFLLSSCQTEPYSDSYSLGGDGDDGEPHHAPFADRLYVILPSDSDGTLAERAQSLCDALAERVEMPTTLFYDDEVIPPSEDTAYVLLGYTVFSESRTALASLKRDDYLCRWNGESRTLILGGKSHAATIAAIDRFCEKTLPYADSSLLLGRDGEFFVSASYPVSSLTLNGHSLGHYVLVYPDEGTRREHPVATALREAMAERCGLYPDLLPASQAEGLERRIEVGICPENASLPPSGARILSDGTVISLIAATPYGLATAAEQFLEFVLPNGHVGDLSASLPAETEVSVTSPDTLFLSLPSPTANDPSDALIQMQEGLYAMQSAGAAVGIFDATSLELCNRLSALPSPYTYSISTLDTQGLAVCYNDAILTRLDSRTQLLDGGAVLVHTFREQESGRHFRLIHAYIADAAKAEAIWESAKESLHAADMPTLLFAYLPSKDLPSLEEVQGTVSLPHERTLLVAYADRNDTVDFRFTSDTPPQCSVTSLHPFLLSYT